MVEPEILIRTEGRAGRITLNRPQTLNALTWDMCRKIDVALKEWATNETVSLLIIDAAPGRAFCAGGDLASMYETGIKGNFDFGRRFWAEEYRMNARLFHFPKPVVTLLHGFTMGGGVGVGCHGSHRIVAEDTQIAMPEVSIGIVPDVGGSLILARAPGRLGEYLGVTASRIDASDAIYAGFADYYIPSAEWSALIEVLCETGEPSAVDRASITPPKSGLKTQQADIDSFFGGETLRDILNGLRYSTAPFAQECLTRISKNAPLAMCCAVELIHRVRARDRIEEALGFEYRFTYRASEQGDFLEGVRATIIDKDRSPNWAHPGPDAPSPVEVARMLMPLGVQALSFEDSRTCKSQ